MSNYYDVLGITRSATERDIRQAYRKLARQHHPDVNPGDPLAEERFKEINEAYSVLSDPENRQKYDKYGDQWERADEIEEARSRSRYRSGSDFQRSTFGDFNPTVTTEETGGSIFDQLFKDLGQRVRRDQEPEYAVEVTLEEAQKGANRLVTLPEGRRLEVRIPPGVDNGSRVHIPAGPSGKGNGNFYLMVSVQDHEIFIRDGRHLYCDMAVPVEDLVLGGEITVPTLSGQVALTIPPETQNGKRFRLAGQGMPTLNQPGERGDLYTTVKVVIPTGLTEHQRDLFRQVKASRSARSR
jgi:DnaJ-class molecular chaperone